MKELQAIDDAVSYIISDPAPVIMLDTCSLLDVMRFPISGYHNHRNVVTAARLIEKNKFKTHLVVTRTVKEEWDRRMDSTYDMTMQALTAIDKQHEALYQAIKELPDLMKTEYPVSKAVSIVALDVTQKIRNLMQEFFLEVICLPNEDAILTKASGRMVLNKAPSKKGKSGPDCAIIEAYLSLVGKLRANNFGGKAFFITSNRKDYCNGQRGIHLDLATDFLGFEIELLLELANLPLNELAGGVPLESPKVAGAN